MKIRKSFVTNSSSSSFVCDICGTQESGWDLGLTDCGMVETSCGHTFCESELIKPVEELTKEELIEIFEDHNDNDMVEKLNNQELDDDLREEIADMMEWSGNYNLPEILCPICQFKIIMENDIVSYLIKISEIKKSEVFEHIKSQNKRRKKLYSSEYINFVLEKIDRTKESIESEILGMFDGHTEFLKFIES